MIKFTWSDAKSAENRRKHSVALEVTVTVFADDNVRLKCDRGHFQKEDRFVFFGVNAKVLQRFVYHAYREKDKDPISPRRYRVHGAQHLPR